MFAYKLIYVDGTKLETKGTTEFEWLTWVKNFLQDKGHSPDTVQFGPWIKKDKTFIRLFYCKTSKGPYFITKVEKTLIEEFSDVSYCN